MSFREYFSLSSKKTIDICSSFPIKPAKFNRLAIYAAYNSKGFVDNSDLHYLKALKEIADNIIYVSDNGLQHGEEKKLQDLVCYVAASRHGEYDFGSYKRGFEYAQKHHLLENIDELIFCNNSCYAPIHRFGVMFNTMKGRKCDFWGITEADEIARHIQSFFLVFRPIVFTAEIFKQFISSITKQVDVQMVIRKYEIGLSQTLYQAGFKSLSYIPYPDINTYPRTICKNNLTTVPVWLMEQGAPILKKKAFTQQLANLDGLALTKKTAIKYNPALRDCLPSFTKCISFLVSDFIYKKKITKSGKLLIKFCRIPVYNRPYNKKESV